MKNEMLNQLALCTLFQPTLINDKVLAVS